MDAETNVAGSKRIRILLLDRHRMFRDGLRGILGSHPSLLVVGESGSVSESLELAASLAPDVILLELNLEDEASTAIIPRLIAASGDGRIILVTGVVDQSIWQAAIQMGVMGIVPKTSPAEVLGKAIVKVYSGEVWIDRAMMANVLTLLTRSRKGEASIDPESARINLLSERERQVIGLIGSGLKNREIANRLSISEITVRHHLSSIYSKLAVADRLELTIYAYRNGLAVLPT